MPGVEAARHHDRRALEGGMESQLTNMLDDSPLVVVDSANGIRVETHYDVHAVHKH